MTLQCTSLINFLPCYLPASDTIAQVKETRRPIKAGANTIPSPVATKYTQRSKENTSETIIVIFIISNILLRN